MTRRKTAPATLTEAHGAAAPAAAEAGRGTAGVGGVPPAQRRGLRPVAKVDLAHRYEAQGYAGQEIRQAREIEDRASRH